MLARVWAAFPAFLGGAFFPKRTAPESRYYSYGSYYGYRPSYYGYGPSSPRYP